MKVKNVLMAMVFSVAVLGGYQAYEQGSHINVDSFLLENVEALAYETEEVVVSCHATCYYTEGRCWKMDTESWDDCMRTDDTRNRCMCT